MTFSQLFFGFHGRINRARYWGATGILFLIALVMTISEIALSHFYGETVGSVAGGVIDVAMMIPNLAVSVKRLHDRNLSAWWLLVGFLAVPFVALGLVLEFTALVAIGAVVFVAAFLWLVVQTGFLRGTVGPNRFGPDPLEPRAGLSLSAAE